MIYTLGETTYDIIFKDNAPFRAVIGGSTLNISVTLGRLSIPVSFISRVGKDHIADISLKFLKENGIICDHITRFEGNSRISLAFLDEDGNASYQFYRNTSMPGFQYPSTKKNDFVAFGSSVALSDENRDELLNFLSNAHNNKSLLFYDPNIRSSDEKKHPEILNKFEENARYAKIIKGSMPDFNWLYKSLQPKDIFNHLAQLGVEILIITNGDKPIEIYTNEFSTSFPTEIVEPISTIGAGDNFLAGIIAGFAKYKIDSENLTTISRDSWNKIISLANTFATEVCLSTENYISVEFAKRVTF
jgi:fructokinase